MNISKFYQKHQSDILFVVGLMATSMIVKWLILDFGILKLMLNTPTHHVSSNIVKYFLLIPAQRLIPVYLLKFAEIGLVTIKTSKSGFGSTMISFCAMDLIDSGLFLIIIPFYPVPYLLLELQTTAVNGLLIWLIWKYTDLSKLRKIILTVITVFTVVMYWKF
jgi:hypothetical protein